MALLLARTMVARGAELAALQEAWSGGGTTRVIRGPAGIGKTRLVRELASWATACGGTVLIGRASTAARGAPLRPIEEALLGAARRGIAPGPELAPFRPALGALVPEWAEAGPGGQGSGESGLVLGEAVLRLLAAQAGERTALLLVEDLHWADPETVAVLEYLADNLAGAPVLLVATVRSGEPGIGTELAASLVHRRAATAVDLRPLPADAVLEVAASCLEGSDAEVPEEAVDDLVARTEGIPFLVEELVATAVDAGWKTVAEAVPGSVATSVELRLDALAPTARRLLVTAALLGRSFEWTVAAAAVGLPDDDAAAVLRDAVRSQLVDADGSGFRFRHALTRDAVLAATPPAELSVLARRALDELRAAAGEGGLDGDRLLVAAELAERAGVPDEAAGLLLDAASAALDSGALRSAERFAVRASEAASGPLADDIGRLLLRIHVLAGHTEPARALGTELLGRFGDDPAAAGEVRRLLGVAELAAGRWDDAERHAEAVAALEPDDVGSRARASVIAAQAAMGRSDVVAAVVHANAALEDATTVGRVPIQCEALEVLGRAERGRDLAAAEAAFQQAHDLAAAAGLDLWRVRALHELGTIDMYERLDAERLEQARQEATAFGALATVAVIDLQLSVVYAQRGELDLALDAAVRCSDASRRWRLSPLAMSLTIQAGVHARRSDRAAMEEAIAAARATGEDRDHVEANVEGQVLAVYQLGLGDLPAAAKALDAAMDVIRRTGVTLPIPGLWALVHTALEAEEADRSDGGGGGDGAPGAKARAEVAALAFDMPVSHQTYRVAEAVAAGRAGDVATAERIFAEADGFLDRHGGGFPRPLAHLLAAPSAHRDGWGDPIGWLREAAASFDSMGAQAFAARCRAVLRELGAPVPRRSSGVAETKAVPPALARLGVTAREVDVLVLVADGATNREVAEQLFISPRTVDKHVERLLQKTGTSRGGLAAVAREVGLRT